MSVLAVCPAKNHFDMYSCSIFFANQSQCTLRTLNLGYFNRYAKEKCYLSYILSSKNGKKKKEIGASSSLPQYFLFCILGIHGYLTLSQEMVRNDCGKYGIYDAF